MVYHKGYIQWFNYRTNVLLIALQETLNQEVDYRTHALKIVKTILKWLVTQKLNFFVGFPPSVQDFSLF